MPHVSLILSLLLGCIVTSHIPKCQSDSKQSLYVLMLFSLLGNFQQQRNFSNRMYMQHSRPQPYHQQPRQYWGGTQRGGYQDFYDRYAEPQRYYGQANFRQQNRGWQNYDRAPYWDYYGYRGYRWMKSSHRGRQLGVGWGGLGLYISFLHPKKEKKQFCGGETAEHVKGQRLDLLSTFCVCWS